jgi:hypothetical protein
MRLKYVPLLLLLSCTREAPEWNRYPANRPPACDSCTTAVVSTKPGCPTISSTHTYAYCGDTAAWSREQTYVWVTPDGTRHDVKTTCNKKR